MAVVASDLLQPAGELYGALFPADTPDAFTARVASYLAQGVAAAASVGDTIDRDAATVAYAYSRAYGDAYARMLSRPASATQEGQGSESYTWAQVQAMGTERDRWRAAYTALLPVTPAVLTHAEPPATVRVSFRL